MADTAFAAALLARLATRDPAAPFWIGESGSRSSGSIRPIRPRAVLTGIGFVSRNIASASGRRR